jgi:prepilin-type N-terminal cleavage/methylation domain-containing protein
LRIEISVRNRREVLFKTNVGLAKDCRFAWYLFFVRSVVVVKVLYQRESRLAFTLVELLVVIAIIGILIAMLLPAVQQVREAARRATCMNNLRQISISLHNFEGAYQRFPAGSYFGTSAANDRGSILIRLLPFLEQNNLYDMFNLNAVPDFQTAPDGSFLASNIISTYLCPSYSGPSSFRFPSPIGHERAVSCYSASKGPTAHINNPAAPCSLWSSWNSLSQAPYDSPGNYAGAFHRRSEHLPISDFPDGTSNTIFFAEVLPTCSGHVMRGWAHTNNGQGLTSTLIPINWFNNDWDHPSGCFRPNNWSSEFGIKSEHPGGAMISMGDASVHFLKATCDFQLLQHLGSRRSGQPVTISSVN